MLPICFEGEYGPDRSPVLTNAYGIPERLKEVDKRFFVMFNRQTQKFEVHVTGQQGTTLSCELPYPDLDYRAIEYLRKYHVSRLFQIAQEIDEYNEKLEQTSVKEALEKPNAKMKEAIVWADRHPSTEEIIPKELVAE